MESALVPEILFAVGVVVAAAVLWGTFAGRVSRRMALAAAAAIGLATVAAWVLFALDATEVAGVSAAGLVVCTAAALAAIPLGGALERAARVDAELGRVESRLRETAEREAAERAHELERTLARARADAISRLEEEERRLAEQRRREFVDRERELAARVGEAVVAAQQRVDGRLNAWAGDLERAQHSLQVQLARLTEQQRVLVQEAEHRIAADVDRLDSAAAEQRTALARLRAEVERLARDAAAAATAELETHAVERRRALHELAERLRRRERELAERIQREEAEAAERITAGFAEVERRQVEALQRAVQRASRGYLDAAANEFSGAIKGAREEAARRLSRELDRAVDAYTRQTSTLIAERMGQVGDAGATRLEKRLNQVAAGVERHREELVADIERRLAHIEVEYRARLESMLSHGEAERAVLEQRLEDISRRVAATIARV